MSALVTKSELIVCGCLRVFWKSASSINIPHEIKLLIIEFYSLHLVWDREKFCGKGFELDGPNSAELRYGRDSVKHRKWGMIAMRDHISLHACHTGKRFEWEFKIDKVFGIDRYFSFMFGFISAGIPEQELTERLNGFHLSTWAATGGRSLAAEHQPYGIHVFRDYKHLHYYGRQKDAQNIEITNTNYVGSETMHFKANDTFGLQFDFGKKECDLYYNRQLITTVFKGFADELIMLFTSFSAINISCTKYNTC